MNNTNEYGLLIMRLSLGIVIIAHSLYLKLMVFTLEGTADYFSSIGLPAMFAYVVFIVEVVTGFMLLVGFKTKIAVLAVIPILLGATWVHLSNGWLFSAPGGGWEYPLFLTAIAVVVLLTKNDSYSLDVRLQRTGQI